MEVEDDVFCQDVLNLRQQRETGTEGMQFNKRYWKFPDREMAVKSMVEINVTKGNQECTSAVGKISRRLEICLPVATSVAITSL